MTTTEKTHIPFQTARLKHGLDMLIRLINIDQFRAIIYNIESQYKNPEAIEIAKKAYEVSERFRVDHPDDLTKQRTHCSNEFGYEIVKAMIVEFGYEKAHDKIRRATILCALSDESPNKPDAETKQDLFRAYLKRYQL